MISYDILAETTVLILDDSHEGILWVGLQLHDTSSDEQYNICVCYLPPEGSSSNVSVQNFFATLHPQVYMYHNNGNFFICGDFNSRCGDRADYVEEPSRHVIDHKTNGYGDFLCDFLVSTSCLMVKMILHHLMQRVNRWLINIVLLLMICIQ